jgi:ribosomal protein S17
MSDDVVVDDDDAHSNSDMSMSEDDNDNGIGDQIQAPTTVPRSKKNRWGPCKPTNGVE